MVNYAIFIDCCESHLRTFCCQIDQGVKIGRRVRGGGLANVGNARILKASVTHQALLPTGGPPGRYENPQK